MSSLEISFFLDHWHVNGLVNLLITVFRDAVSDLALHFLAKMKIMVVKDIEREDIEFVCKVSTKAFSLSHSSVLI